LPADFPAHLTADISGLVEAGQHVVAGDIELPTGLELVAPADEVVVTVVAPTVVEEAAEEAVAEGEAPSEAAAVAEEE
jgi:large subunit ribosomal protein L25